MTKKRHTFSPDDPAAWEMAAELNLKSLAPALAYAIERTARAARGRSGRPSRSNSVSPIEPVREASRLPKVSRGNDGAYLDRIKKLGRYPTIAEDHVWALEANITREAVRKLRGKHRPDNLKKGGAPKRNSAK